VKKIKEFRINRDKDSLDNVGKVKSIIDQFGSQKDINNLNLELSQLLEIPADILIKKMKQIVYRTFDYKDKNKEPKFKINFNLYDALKYLILFIGFTLFRKKIKKQKDQRKKVGIILDNVEKLYVVEKFSKILSYFKKPLVLTNKQVLNQINLKPERAEFVNEHFSFLSNNILKDKKIPLLKFIIRLLFLSVKYQLNLLRIFFPIFYTTLKYYKIFSLYESKFLIFDRIYHCCPLRNYIFKKAGGRKVLCLQSHLQEATISLFSDIDTLVTFGKENDTEKKLKLFGGKINESFPGGSVRMEYELRDKKDIDKIEPIDILVIGINSIDWLWPSNKIPKIYYEQIKWLAKISKKNPNLKILYKHHPNFTGDPVEKEILNSTNIKTITKPEKNLNSYHFLFKSKLIVSFGSTMILEALSLEKKCYFLDPGLENSTFFGNLDYLKDTRISSCEEFEKIIEKLVTKSESLENKESKKFCLSHENASERIYKYILNN
jgi:hypothetical protein